MPETIPLSDLAMAAFCPRKLYYARTRDRRPPPEYERARDLAGRYSEILEKNADVDASEFGTDRETALDNLTATKAKLDAWPELIDPAATDVFLEGREVHGRVNKVLADPLAPTLVSPGEPPPEGVWQPQAVRAVGAAKALAWERETPVEQAYVEYARYGVIRRVSLTTRRKAAYRRTVRTVRALDGPPPRIKTEAKCRSCEFATDCGAKTRSLRSLL